MSSKIIESYNIGDISVTISEAEHPEKVHIECNDGTYHSEFTIRKYEYKNYKRHMNQRIKNAYKRQHKEEE